MICLPSDDQVASAASTGSAERRPDSVSRMFGSARPVFSSTSTKSSSAVPAGLQRGSRGTSPCGQPQGDGSNGRRNWATKLVTPVERSYVMTCVSSQLRDGVGLIDVANAREVPGGRIPFALTITGAHWHAGGTGLAVTL